MVSVSHAADVKESCFPVLLDKERTLKYDLNSFIELEELYGSIEGALKEMEKGTGQMKAVRAVLWAGLLHEDPSLTVKSVGAMLSLRNLDAVSQTLSAAIEAALPKGTDTKNPL